MTFRLPRIEPSDAQREEARRIIAAQAATAPKDGNLSPEAALRRASPCGTDGKPLDLEGAAPVGFPSQMRWLLGEQR